MLLGGDKLRGESDEGQLRRVSVHASSGPWANRRSHAPPISRHAGRNHECFQRR